MSYTFLYMIDRLTSAIVAEMAESTDIIQVVKPLFVGLRPLPCARKLGELFDWGCRNPPARLLRASSLWFRALGLFADLLLSIFAPGPFFGLLPRVSFVKPLRR